MLPLLNGVWLGVSNTGNILVFGETEQIVVDKLQAIVSAEPGILTTYVNCLGREVLRYIAVDDSVNSNKDVPLVVDLKNNGLKQSRGEIWFTGYHAYSDSQSWTEHEFKHASGSSVTFAPSIIFDQMTCGVTRLSDVVMRDVGQRRSRVIGDQLIKINNLITKIPLIEHDRWLIGYDVWSRYTNIVDTSKSKPLEMIPKPDEQDHK